jgi:hypothetical protein
MPRCDVRLAWDGRYENSTVTGSIFSPCLISMSRVRAQQRADRWVDLLESIVLIFGRASVAVIVHNDERPAQYK